jgi:outer membrane protein assembly factor BamB
VILCWPQPRHIMKITEISFTPTSEQRTALVYSERSSRSRSLHLFFQHESNEQQPFLHAAFKETVERYLSPIDLKPPLGFLPLLIERFESIQEEQGVALNDLQGMGLFLLLQEAGSVFLLTSQENQVQFRMRNRVECLETSDVTLYERLDAFEAPPQEELFPRRLRDALTLTRIRLPADNSLEIILSCREDELGVVFDAIRDAEPRKAGEVQELPLDVLSRRVLYVRFGPYEAAHAAAGERDLTKMSLRAPFGLIHITAIVATAAVVFIAGAAWISGRAGKQSSDTPPAGPSQASLERAAGEPESVQQDHARDSAAEESTVDLASIRLERGWTKKYEQGVTSSPAANGPSVIFGCRDGKMRALNATTGEEMWVHEAAGGIGASPVVAGGRVIGADYGGTIFALDSGTGERVWSSKLPGRVVSSPCVSGERVVVGCFDNFVYCLSVPDGQVLWNAGANGKVWGSAAAADETFFIPSYDGNLYALSAGTGEVLWTYNIGGEIRSSPAVSGGNVIIGAPDGGLHAIDRASGRVVWSFRAGAPIQSFLLAAEGRVYFGSNDTHLYCVDGREGTLIWKCKTGGYVFGRPCAAGGLLFIGSYDSVMYCLNMETGTVIDRFDTSGKIYSSPAVDKLRLFFGNNEGEFFCLHYSNESTS